MGQIKPVVLENQRLWECGIYGASRDASLLSFVLNHDFQESGEFEYQDKSDQDLKKRTKQSHRHPYRKDLQQ